MLCTPGSLTACSAAGSSRSIRGPRRSTKAFGRTTTQSTIGYIIPAWAGRSNRQNQLGDDHVLRAWFAYVSTKSRTIIFTIARRRRDIEPSVLDAVLEIPYARLPADTIMFVRHRPPLWTPSHSTGRRSGASGIFCQNTVLQAVPRLRVLDRQINRPDPDTLGRYVTP